MLTLFSASREQTAAMMPTRSLPTTVTMACIVFTPLWMPRRGEWGPHQAMGAMAAASPGSRKGGRQGGRKEKRM